MFVPNGWTALGSILPTDSEHAETTMIEIKALDEFVHPLSLFRIDLLKIDTEGSEGAVLRGAFQTLNIVDRVVLEYHSAALLEECLAILNARGFAKRLCLETDSNASTGILYASK
jgi:hypothetical protein